MGTDLLTSLYDLMLQSYVSASKSCPLSQSQHFLKILYLFLLNELVTHEMPCSLRKDYKSSMSFDVKLQHCNCELNTENKLL